MRKVIVLIAMVLFAWGFQQCLGTFYEHESVRTMGVDAQLHHAFRTMIGALAGAAGVIVLLWNALWA